MIVEDDVTLDILTLSREIYSVHKKPDHLNRDIEGTNTVTLELDDKVVMATTFT